MRSIFFFIVCVLLIENVISQNKEDSYIIITYESKFNKAPKEVKIFHWIVKTDFLKKANTLSPLYFDGYSKTSLDKCSKGEIISPFEFFDNESWDFDKKYSELLAKVKNLITKKKQKIMTIKKKWGNGLKEKMTIYLTPVKGKFTHCGISENALKKINYDGNIYLPLENISWDKNFNLNQINTFLLHKIMRVSDPNNR